MVQFDDLHLGHVLRRHAAHQHHQYRADGKIRCNKRRRIILLCRRLDLTLLFLRDARRPNHG